MYDACMSKEEGWLYYQTCESERQRTCLKVRANEFEKRAKNRKEKSVL